MAAPGETTCSTGAAIWMATRSPAAARWAAAWPEMLNVSADHTGDPAHSSISHNRYCDCSEFLSSNVAPENLTQWQVSMAGNVETHDCGS